MRKSLTFLTLLILAGCAQEYKFTSTTIPALPESEVLALRFQEIKRESLVKEIDFETTTGVLGGATVSNKEVHLANPTNQNQYVDTGVSVKNTPQSTVSLWFKTSDIHKVQFILWQGQAGQNGWGCGYYPGTAVCSEFHVGLNYTSDTTGTILHTFLGVNEQARNSDPRPLSYPVTWNLSTDTPQVTGRRVTLDLNWHHLAVTVEQRGSLVETRTYLDGTLLESGVGYQVDISNWNSSMFLGRPGANNSRNFSGSLKSFAAFNKVLSDQDILTIYKIQKLEQ